MSSWIDTTTFELDVFFEMPKKQKRDSAYYEKRPKNDYSTIYADLKAGKHKTITEAAIAAGLTKPRTRLQELKNSFNKATNPSRLPF